MSGQHCSSHSRHQACHNCCYFISICLVTVGQTLALTCHAPHCKHDLRLLNATGHVCITCLPAACTLASTRPSATTLPLLDYGRLLSDYSRCTATWAQPRGHTLVPGHPWQGQAIQHHARAIASAPFTLVCAGPVPRTAGCTAAGRVWLVTPATPAATAEHGQPTLHLYTPPALPAPHCCCCWFLLGHC